MQPWRMQAKSAGWILHNPGSDLLIVTLWVANLCQGSLAITTELGRVTSRSRWARQKRPSGPPGCSEIGHQPPGITLHPSDEGELFVVTSDTEVCLRLQRNN